MSVRSQKSSAQKNLSRLVIGISTYDIMSFFVGGEGGQKWGEENKMRGKKFGRFQKSVIRASPPSDVETGGEWRAKRKLQTLKAISMFLVGNCREKNLRNS